MAKARKSSLAQRPVRKLARPKSAHGKRLPGIEILRYAALAVVCILCWCVVYGRLSGDSWNVPIEYGIQPDLSDVKACLAAFKAAEDGSFWPIVFHNIPQLGAPYIGNWNDYPCTEDILIWSCGAMAKVFGLFAASNLLVLTLQVLAALAFYFMARRFKCDWKWSFVGALLFGLAPYGFAHSLHHFVITAYWHVALGILVFFWLCNGRGLRFRTRDYWIAVAVAIITGWQNVYYTSVFIQMAGIALIVQWYRRGWRAALPALSIGCIAFAAFIVMNLDTIGYGLIHGRNPGAAVRSYRQMDFYALKLIDCFIPYPTHRFPPFAALSSHYFTSTLLPAEVPPACYFGIFGIAAFVWMAVYTVRIAIARDRKRIPFEAVLTLWFFAYASVGGVNAMLGVLNFQLFRSTTRFCIVILGLSLLFAIRRLSILSKRWPSPWPVVLPLAVAGIGLWDIVPPIAGEDMAATAAAVNSDRTFAQEMESVLPKGGMVFELPVMDSPESPIAGLAAYDHYRPYLYTKDLRYAFGSNKGRPQDAWQRVVAAMPPAEQVAALESYGFSGIYINPDAYPDHAQNLISQFKAAGIGNIITSPREDLYCVVLKPSPNPVLPPPGPLFAEGWYTEQDSPNGQRDHFSTGDGTLVLTNPSTVPVDKYANFYVASLTPRSVIVQGDGAYQIWHLDQQHPVKVTNLHFTLPPGESKVYFGTDVPAVQAQSGLISFDLVNFDLTDFPRPEQ